MNMRRDLATVVPSRFGNNVNVMTRAIAEPEQSAAQIDARDNGELLALARRAANAGTWDLDLVERVVRYCPRSLEMLGHPPDRSPELTVEEWARHIFPGDAERVLSEGVQARDSGTDLITEYRIVRPDGGIRWIRGMGRTLRNAAGDPVRSVGFNFDVTDEKMAEADNRRLQSELVKASRASARMTVTDTLARELEGPLSAIAARLAEAREALDGLSDARSRRARVAVDQAAEMVEQAADAVTSLRAMTRRRASKSRSPASPSR